MSKTVLLIDTSNLLYRSYHAGAKYVATAYATREDGTSIGALSIFGYKLLGLLSGKSRTLGKVDHAIACFESDRNFRRLIYPDYKANRGESDSHEREEIYEQLDMTPDLCKAFGVACVSVRYFEADDVIATLATKLSKKGFHPIIVSTDKDLAQLSQLPNCKVYHPYNDIFIEEFQTSLELALSGDRIDNIPSIRGIGTKTAAKLHPSSLKKCEHESSKIRITLHNNMPQLRLNLALTGLVADCPVKLDLNALPIPLSNTKSAAKYAYDQGLFRLSTALNKVKSSSGMKKLFHSNTN